MNNNMVSIKEVAKHAGVSIATVSRYINNPDQVREKTRERVRESVEQLGYAPNTLARNFRRGKSGIVLVILPVIGTPFLAKVMEGIRSVAHECNYKVLIQESRLHEGSVDEYSNMILGKQADGVILVAADSPFGHSAEGQPKLPIVISCETVTPELSSFPSVRINNLRAAQDATDYLLNLGHTKISFITGSSDSKLTLDRERGFLRAMQSKNVDVQPSNIVEGGLSLDGGRRATRQILSQATLPTAVFCANDEMAIGCIHEIKAAGLRVPDDISVVGFDDILFAEVTSPPLTTVAQPAEEIGERSMRRLLSAIDGQDIGTEPDIVEHQLVIRKSTAAPH